MLPADSSQPSRLLTPRNSVRPTTRSVCDEPAGEDFGGVLTQYVIYYLQDHAPEGTLGEVLRLADEVRGAATLCDVNGWSSYAQHRRLLEATGDVLGGTGVLTKIGLSLFESIRVPEML